MNMSKAKYEANRRWNEANLSKVQFDIPKDKAREIDDFIKRNGLTKRQFFLSAIEEKMFNHEIPF